MKSPFQDKVVVLGVTGSISCYKAVDLASKLTQAGALVDVILTDSATQFVTPLTFRSITHRQVVVEMFESNTQYSLEHVALARRADVVVVAPATAHTIAKMAHGLADNMLTTTLLATEAPIVVAPAMDANMNQSPAVKKNLAALHEFGITVVGPLIGRLASGLWGSGRLMDPPELMGHIAAVLGKSGDLVGRTVVVSAGGTAEPIDPVRVVTNRSSGKQGYALAEAARDRGARVTLVATHTKLADPAAVEVIHIETVAQMRTAILKACEKADVLIMAAAVSDFRPATAERHKIKKPIGDDTLSLELAQNPDFLLEVPDRLVKVGFAAESKDLLKNARQKLATKRLNLIAANDITKPDSGFGTESNRVTILDNDGGVEEVPLCTKYEVGHRILDRVATLLNQRS